MPGQASLSATEYYAHPRNTLWPIMYALITGSPAGYGIHDTIDYPTRCKLLIDHGYALWDVLQSCDRPGSLDSSIDRHSEQPNDIASLATAHPELRCIAFNGRTAEKLFNKHILDTLPVRRLPMGIGEREMPPTSSLRRVSLPSTSPAMASLSIDEKYQRWAEGLLG